MRMFREGPIGACVRGGVLGSPAARVQWRWRRQRAAAVLAAASRRLLLDATEVPPHV